MERGKPHFILKINKKYIKSFQEDFWGWGSWIFGGREGGGGARSFSILRGGGGFCGSFFGRGGSLKMGVGSGGWGWGGQGVCFLPSQSFLFLSLGNTTFSGEGGVEGGEGLGASDGGDKFRIVELISLVGLKQEGQVRGVVELWAVLGKGGGRGRKGMGIMESFLQWRGGGFGDEGEGGGWGMGRGKGTSGWYLFSSSCRCQMLARWEAVLANAPSLVVLLEVDSFVGGVGGEVSFNCFQEFQVKGE